MKRILFVDNTAHHLYGQMHLMLAFKNIGYEVIALIPDDKNYFSKIQANEIKCYSIYIAGKSLNPFKDLKLIFTLRKVFKKIKPNLICSFTIKPNLYASIIARQQNIPIITNVTGLGYVFLKNNWLAKFVSFLYKFAYHRASQVFFQNKDDRILLEQAKIFSKNTTLSVIPGSGVNLNKFNYVGLTNTTKIKFLFSGRLLWDKGILELIEAFKAVRNKYLGISLTFIGNYFLENPNAVLPEQIEAWVQDGVIKYLGMIDNVFEVMSQVDCIVLPSYYREGVPRVLMEACSMGKPIITVDNVGCRDVIEDGINGFMAKPRDIQSLADAMIRFIELPFAQKQQLGINGRKKMEQEFDQRIVVNKYLEASNRLIC